MKIKQILMYSFISVCVASYSNVYSTGTDVSESVITESYESFGKHPDSPINDQDSNSVHEIEDEDYNCCCVIS